VRLHPDPGPGSGLRPLTGYGYQWWTTSEQGHRAFTAIGLGGQLVEVVPDLDLVVMTRCPGTAEEARAGSESQRLVGNVIVPAVSD
jgi:hypothetical protein